jgi:peptidoglycan/xylan/chitin deacetylase (PgdA/CDA1 family)
MKMEKYFRKIKGKKLEILLLIWLLAITVLYSESLLDFQNINDRLNRLEGEVANGSNHTDRFVNPDLPFSYLIDVSGGNYRRENCTSGQIEDQSTNVTNIESNAMGNLTSGIIFLKEVAFDRSLTVGANILVIESYQGNVTTYTSSGCYSGFPQLPYETSLDFKNNMPPRTFFFLSNFENVSEWTVTQGGTSQADTTNFVEGTQGLNMTTGASSNQIVLDKSVTLDLSNAHFTLWVYIPALSIANLSALDLQLRTTDSSWSSYYRYTLGYWDFVSGWNNVVCPRNDAKAFGNADWTKVNHLVIRLLSKHAGDQISATLADYEAVIETFPAKVMFRFDDDNKDTYISAKPIMDKYGYKGVAAIPTGSVNVASEMTTRQLSTLYDSGWDLVSHTVTHASLTSLSISNIDYELYASQKWLLDNGFARGARFFVPPGENTNSTVDAEIKKYYLASLAGQGWNYYPFSDQYHILSKDVFNSSTDLPWGSPNGWYPQATIQSWVNTAVANNQILILTIHHVNTTIFQGVVDYVHSLGIEVVTLSDLFDRPFTLTSRLRNSGIATSCVNGTWIAHGLCGTPNGQETLIIMNNTFINSTCYIMQPSIIAQNSTMFQISLLINNAGTITSVVASDSQTISWYVECKP